jgi:hypothetical protein
LGKIKVRVRLGSDREFQIEINVWLDPKIVAEQISLVSSKLFRQIEFSDISQSEPSANILALNKHLFQLSFWVADEIEWSLRCGSTSGVLLQFFRVLDGLWSHHNAHAFVPLLRSLERFLLLPSVQSYWGALSNEVLLLPLLVAAMGKFNLI